MADDEMMGQQFDAEHDKNAIADRRSQQNTFFTSNGHVELALVLLKYNTPNHIQNLGLPYPAPEIYFY